MIKTLKSTRTVSILIISLLVFSFAGTALSTEIKDTVVIKGTIISASIDTREVVLNDTLDTKITLTAGKDIILEDLHKGDQVIVECNNEMIESITKQQ